MSARALRSLGAATVLALGLLGLVPHAASARAPEVVINAPGRGASVTVPTISGQASMQNGEVRSVTLKVTSAEGHPVPGPNAVPAGSSTVPFSWTPSLAYNGNYVAEATAVGRDNFDLNGDESFATNVSFALNAPPSTPDNLKVVVDQAARTVTISWAPNPEPDTFAYGVYRKSGTNWVERKVGSFTSYTDSIGSLPAGTYQYQVIAARTNAAGDDFVPSAPAGASAKVTSDPPPPPTTTTVAGARSGGSGSTTTVPGGATDKKSPTLATHGKADLSGFTALLPQSTKLPTARSVEPEGTYEENLPFDQQGGGPSSTAKGSGDDVAALGGQTLASSNDESRPTSLLFLAAGLLVTVLLMHVLWLRDEVNKEPLPIVEDGPAS